MLRKSKKINILIISVVLALVFLLSVNVAYAYFMTESSASGGFGFYDFKINFSIYEGPSDTSGEEIENSTYLPVVPAAELYLGRGVEFAVRKTEDSEDLLTRYSIAVVEV